MTEKTTEQNQELLAKEIPETNDLIVFGRDFVEDLDKHMADDGKIDGYEIGMTFLENIPGALKTYAGAGAIPEEVKKMSQEVKDAALAELLTLVKDVAALVQKRNK